MDLRINPQGDDSGNIGDSASISLLPPPSYAAPPTRPVPPSPSTLPRSVPASFSASFKNPVTVLPPNTMSRPLEAVPPSSTMRTCVCCLVLGLILFCGLMAGGLGIASKKGAAKKQEEAEASVVCTDPNGCDGNSATSRSGASTLAGDTIHGKEGIEGHQHDSIVSKDPADLPRFEYNIDSLLQNGDFAQQAKLIRSQGFEIKQTDSGPLLHQPNAADVSSKSFKYDYITTWFKSLLMFEVQRGGTQAADSRTWREDDATSMDEATVGSETYSMDGGWFEAGNHLKVTIPTGFTVARLAWMCEYYSPTLSKLKFEGGGSSDFGSTGSKKNKGLFHGKTAYEWCKREILWGASWLQKAAVLSSHGSVEVIVVQCGRSLVDHGNVLSAERITGGPRDRPCAAANETHPASADAAQLAAGLAAAARMFSSGTPDEQSLAKDWMKTAKAALEFAGEHNGDKQEWFKTFEEFALYPTSMLEDHIFFAEASLFLASVAMGDSDAANTYFEAAMYSYDTSPDLQARCTVPLSNWDAPCHIAMLMMVQGSGDFTSWFGIQLVQGFVNSQIGREDVSSERMVGVGDITITPKGARFFSGGLDDGKVWATLRSLNDAASIAALVADFPGIDQALQKRYRCLTASQINYVLGDTGRSYVIGAGKDFPKAAHSRESFCAKSWDTEDCTYNQWFKDSVSNGNNVVGAIVGGPDLKDKYVDSRANFRSTEIAIDFQATFFSALTGALTIPADFWHDGDISELGAACDATGFKYYNWEGSDE